MERWCGCGHRKDALMDDVELDPAFPHCALWQDDCPSVSLQSAADRMLDCAV
jgi:hypothetical protein